MPSQVGTSTRVPFGDGVCFLLSISLDPLLSSGVAPVTPLRSQNGNVEKIHQRRSRPFVVLTYSMYTPRAKRAVALLDEPFGKTQGRLF